MQTSINADHYEAGKAALIKAKDIDQESSDWIIDSVNEALKSPREIEAIGSLLTEDYNLDDFTCILMLVRALA